LISFVSCLYVFLCCVQAPSRSTWRSINTQSLRVSTRVLRRPVQISYTCEQLDVFSAAHLIFVCVCVLLLFPFDQPWHADILPFLELKKNHGIEEERARDLFYGLWICDLFMKRVEEDGPWSLSVIRI
jgi:hypothetical protein